jgi:hypothetical protein
MPFNSLPVLAKIIVGIFAPLAITVFCWYAGPRLMRARSKRKWNWIEFWLMLIAAYLIAVLVLWGGRFLAPKDDADPSLQLVQ